MIIKILRLSVLNFWIVCFNFCIFKFESDSHHILRVFIPLDEGILTYGSFPLRICSYDLRHFRFVGVKVKRNHKIFGVSACRYFTISHCFLRTRDFWRNGTYLEEVNDLDSLKFNLNAVMTLQICPVIFTVYILTALHILSTSVFSYWVFWCVMRWNCCKYALLPCFGIGFVTDYKYCGLRAGIRGYYLFPLIIIGLFQIKVLLILCCIRLYLFLLEISLDFFFFYCFLSNVLVSTIHYQKKENLFSIASILHV